MNYSPMNSSKDSSSLLCYSVETPYISTEFVILLKFIGGNTVIQIHILRIFPMLN